MASIDPGTGAIDLGNIQNERNRKATDLFIQALVASDSNAAIILDLFGTIRRISVDGIFTGNNTELNDFIVALGGIINGAQTGSTFVSSLTTFASKTVLVEDFTWNYAKGDPNKINYNLSMVEGV